METIGTDALVKAKLVIVAGITFRCTFIYKVDGEPADLTGWSAYMDFWQGDTKKLNVDACVAVGSDGSVQIHMPPDITSQLSEGSYDYDIVLEDGNGDTVRLALGKAQVKRRYSYDG